MTKISVQYAGLVREPSAGDTVGQLINAGVKAIKVVNEFGVGDTFDAHAVLVFARDEAWQRGFQNGLDVRLRHRNANGDFDGPQIEAQKWLDHHLPLAAAHPRFVWEITNEWKAWSREGGVWVIDHELTRLYAKMEAIIMRAMRSGRYTVVGWNFALSQPPYEAIPDLMESIAAANEGRHYLGLHLYTSPFVTSSYGPEGRPEDFLYRYHEISVRNNLRSRFPFLRWVGTEFFIDEVDGNGYSGFKKAMNAAKAEEQLFTIVDPILNSHPELEWVFIYCLGRDGGSNDGKAEFDVLDSRGDYNLFARLLPHLAGTVPAPIPPPNPNPIPPPTPTGGGEYRVEVGGPQYTLNVRRGPSTSYAVAYTLENKFPLVIESIASGWAKIYGLPRWVSAQYIRPLK